MRWDLARWKLRLPYVTTPPNGYRGAVCGELCGDTENETVDAWTLQQDRRRKPEEERTRNVLAMLFNSRITSCFIGSGTISITYLHA